MKHLFVVLLSMGLILSGEIAQIEARLAKKRDKHLLECRKQFGDRGWACQGSW